MHTAHASPLTRRDTHTTVEEYRNSYHRSPTMVYKIINTGLQHAVYMNVRYRLRSTHSSQSQFTDSWFLIHIQLTQLILYHGIDILSAATRVVGQVVRWFWCVCGTSFIMNHVDTRRTATGYRYSAERMSAVQLYRQRQRHRCRYRTGAGARLPVTTGNAVEQYR